MSGFGLRSRPPMFLWLAVPAHSPMYAGMAPCAEFGDARSFLLLPVRVKTRSPFSKPHVRSSREQTLVAPREARCSIREWPSDGAGSAMPSTELLPGENFFCPGKVRRPEFQKLWPQGWPRLAAADNRHAVPAKKANRRTAMMQKPKPPRPPKPPAPPPPEPLPPAA